MHKLTHKIVLSHLPDKNQAGGVVRLLQTYRVGDRDAFRVYLPYHLGMIAQKMLHHKLMQFFYPIPSFIQTPLIQQKLFKADRSDAVVITSNQDIILNDDNLFKRVRDIA